MIWKIFLCHPCTNFCPLRYSNIHHRHRVSPLCVFPSCPSILGFLPLQDRSKQNWQFSTKLQRHWASGYRQIMILDQFRFGTGTGWSNHFQELSRLFSWLFISLFEAGPNFVFSSAMFECMGGLSNQLVRILFFSDSCEPFHFQPITWKISMHSSNLQASWASAERESRENSSPFHLHSLLPTCKSVRAAY